MIRKEYMGKEIRIISKTNGIEYTGKAVELQSPEESESGELEIGINYAGGITMFPESDIKSIALA